jgi:hypothetical protein
MIIPAVLTVAIVGAQAPEQQPPAQPSTAKPAQAAQAPAKGNVTVTGCVASGASAGTWVLNDAQMGSAAAAAKAETPAPAGTAGATQTYNLVAKPGGEDLKVHANHKVEITGTLSPAAAAAGAAEKPGAAATAKQNLNIESVKVVSPTC